MIKKILIVLLLFSIQAKSQNNFSSLEMAQMAANWLQGLEKNNGNQSCWPEYEGSNSFQTGKSSGCAGIGEFLLKLYSQTGDNKYLQSAKQAANYIYFYYFTLNNFTGPDYLDGAASGGRYFLKLYNVCKEEIYLDYAKFTAEWLKNEAINVNDEKCYWKQSPTFPKIYTGMAHGAAGIAYFFAEMYEVAKDEQYLNVADKAVNWINDYSIKIGENGIGYKRLTTDTEAYNLWCGGTTGIVTLYEKLYVLTENQKYLDKLTECAEGLLYCSKQKTSTSIYWGYNYPESESTQTVAYCHGTSSTSIALLKAWKYTNDTRYLDAAIKGLNFVKGTLEFYSNNIYFYPHLVGYNTFETGYFTGQASVGRAFIEAYQLTKEKEYLELAENIKKVLSVTATLKSGNKMCWYNLIYNVPREHRGFYTSYYCGAAGIGSFLIDLSKELLETPLGDISNIAKTEQNTLTVYQNYPNPFNRKTNITYEITLPTYVKLKITDIQGNLIDEINIEKQAIGKHSLQIDLKNKPNGVYFYQINTKHSCQTMKMIYKR